MDMRLDDLADSIPLAISGFVSVLLLTAFGLINIHIGEYRLALSGLPLMGIFLWPRMAAPLLSLFFVFCAGLFQDVVNAQPFGMSAFLFVVIYTFFRCRFNRKSISFLNIWRQFFILVICVVAIIVFFSFLTRIPFGSQNALITIGMTLIVFPLYFGFWKFCRKLFLNREEI